MPATLPPQRGFLSRIRPAFSAIEIVLVLGLLATSIGLSVPLYDQYRARSDVQRTVDTYVQMISVAKGTAQKGSGYQYGVHFSTGDIFTGDTYDTRVDEHHEFDVPASVEVSGLTEISFSCNEGLPSVTGYVRVASKVIPYGRRIDIDVNGFVALASLDDPLPISGGLALRALQQVKGICKPSAGIASSSSSSLPPPQLCTPELLYAGAPQNNVFGFGGAQWVDSGRPGEGATHLSVLDGKLYASAAETLYRCTETGWVSVASGSAPITALGVHAHRMYYGMLDGSIGSYDGSTTAPVTPITPSPYGVTALQSYDSYLYAAGDGVFRLGIEGGWTRVLQIIGFVPIALGTHDDKLYAGGGSSACSEGLIYSSSNGSTWALAGTLPGRIQTIADFNDTLFAGGTFGQDGLIRGYVSRLEGSDWIFSGENEMSVNVLSVYRNQLFAAVDTGSASCDCGINTSLPSLITPPQHSTVSSEEGPGGTTGATGGAGGGSMLPFIPKAQAFIGSNNGNGTLIGNDNTVDGQCMISISNNAGAVTQYDGGTSWRSLRSFTKPVTALTSFETSSNDIFPTCNDSYSAPSDPPVSVSLSDQWVTDGPVYTMARNGSTLYLGGQFGRIGPNTGKGVPLSTSTGEPTGTFPRVNGPVYAVVSDGAGGWYIGGSFTTVGGKARKNLAYVRSNGAVDNNWKPTTNGTVFAIGKSASAVYIGGEFTMVNDSLRSNAAAINVSGADAGVQFGLNGTVRSIAVSATKVAFGGDFTFGNPLSPSRYVAVYNFAGGEQDTSISVPSPVYVLKFKDESKLMLGGDFGLQENNTLKQSGTAVGSVRAIAFDGNTTYVGSLQSSSSLPSLFKLNNAFNIVSGWNQALPAGSIFSLTIASPVLYVGGDFEAVGGVERRHIAAINTSGNGSLTSWDPSMSDAVYALALNGTTLYAGGEFKTVGGLARRNAAALDITSDTVLSWNPSPTLTSKPQDSSVATLAYESGRVYLGGTFSSVSGLARTNFVAVDAVSGAPVAWSADANAPVNAVVVRNGTVYVGGYFTSLAGTARSYAAALTSAGTVTPWEPSPDAPVTSLAVDRCSVFVGGYFTTIGGATRQYLAAVDPSIGTASTWDPNPDSWITTLTVRRPTLYIGGLFNRLADTPRSNLAAVSVTTGNLRPWRPDPDGVVWSIAPTSSSVVVAGAFTTLAGHERKFIGAVDASTGQAMSWNPNADGIVSALAVSGDDVFAGGNFGGMVSFTDPKPHVSSLRVTAVPTPETAVCVPPGNSDFPSVSADGTRIAFTAPSSIVVNGSNGGTLDTFVYDRRSQEVRRVSVSTDGTPVVDYQSRGGPPSISADGRYVAFPSLAKLLASDTNSVSDIYVYDLQTNQLSLASTSASGVVGNAASTRASISPDGRFLAFTSQSTNLTGDGAAGLFFKNLQTGAISLISRRTNGQPATGSFGLSSRAISRDGKFVVFTSSDGNLVAGDTNGWEDVFVYNASAGSISAVSVSSAGQWSNTRTLPFISASISDDGSSVIFNSEGTNLVANDTNGFPDIFVHRLATHQTIRVSLGTDGQQLFGQTPPSIGLISGGVPLVTVESSGLSDDGQIALFTAYPADNLYSCGYIKRAGKQAFVRDITAQTTTIVSISTDGATAASGLLNPSLSADGAHVAFTANDGIMPNDANAYPNVYVRDLDTGITESGQGPFNCAGSAASSPSCSIPTSSVPGCTEDSLLAPLHANDEVHAISAALGRAFIGGTFTDINQIARNRFAVIDEATGDAIPCFDPVINGPVYAVKAIGSTVYIGGRFTTVDGQPRNNLAAFNAVTGQLLSWNPSVTGVSAESTAVYALETSSVGNVYIGGSFSQVSGSNRQHAAAVDSITGAVSEWNPQLSPASVVRAIRLGSQNSRVYLGGYRLLKAVDPWTGATQTGWNPRSSDATSDTLFAIDYDPASDTVYVGGDFTALGSAVRRGVAAIDGTTGVVKPWNASIDSEGFSSVRTVIYRDRLYIGGGFSSMQNQSRTNVAAFERTGALSTWNPGADGQVFALARGSERLFLGGRFQNVGGREARRFAQILFSQSGGDSCLSWPAGAAEVIIDNGRLGYQETGDPWSTGTVSNFGTDPRVATVNPDTQTQSAAWCFDRVPPGEYEVRATWPAAFNNARSALYTMRLSTDPSRPQEGRVNQANPPRRDALAGGTPFQTLATINPPGTGSVIVGLGNRAAINGFPTYSATVFADAVWIARTTPCIPNATSTAPAVSTDGRYIVFVSAATNLITGDGNTYADIFVFDSLLKQLSRVSRSTTGGDPNGHSGAPSISSDGRYVVFSSAATNLVAGDTNEKSDIFLFDRQTSSTTRISAAYDGSQANGDSGSPAISGDGRFVAFASLATNLVTGDTNAKKDIFVFDRIFGSITRVSVYGNGSQITSDAFAPAISGDGKIVAYLTNGWVGQTYTAQNQMVLYDLQTGAVSYAVRIPAHDTLLSPKISLNSDGRYAAYASSSRNLFLFDRVANATSVIRSNAWNPSLSADARYIAFNAAVTNSGDQAYLLDQYTGAVTTISTRANATLLDGAGAPSLSGDAHIVTFGAKGIVPTHDVVVMKDIQTGSLDSVSIPASCASSSPSSLTISNLTISAISTTSATITWQTNVPADTLIRYGETTAYGTSAPSQPSPLTTSHSVTLTGLSPFTQYHFVAISANATARATSPDTTFTTLSTSSAAPCVAGFPTSSFLPGLWEANGPVRAVVRSNNIIYIGGDFTSVSGQARQGLAALDATTGQVTAWNPGVNAPVHALALNGSVLYVGGRFTQAGGQDRNCLAAINASNGIPLSWNPSADGVVRALLPLSDRLIVGGSFGTLNGVSAYRLGALDRITGASVDGWNTYTDSAGTVYDLATDGSTLFVGGDFHTIGSASRDNVAALTLPNGSVKSFSANTDGPVRALALDTDRLYIGGSFSAVSGQNRQRLAALDKTDATVLSWNPAPASAPVVHDIVVQGGIAYVGGGVFGSIGGATKNSALVALTAAGAATSWNPSIQSGDVYSLFIASGAGYAGGTFQQIQGQEQRHFSPVSLLNGSFDATPPVITSIRATGIGCTQATIEWDTHELADSQVEYGLTTAYGSTSPLPTPLTLNHSVSLRSLLAQSTYHFRVKSKDAAGNLAVSADQTFTSSDCTAPIISNVRVSAITRDSATITWLTNEPADTQVEYGTTLAYGSSSALTATPVTAHSVQLTGLASQTLYHFRVKSRDPSGNLAQSPDATFSTLDATPPVISDITSTNIRCNSVTITWLTNEPADTQVDYGTTAVYGSSSGLNATPVTSHIVQLTGLASQTLYHFRVRSKDAAGNFTVSSDYTFTTSDCNAPVISNVRVVNIAFHSARILWDTAENADSQVEYGQSTSYGTLSALPTPFATTHSVDLTGLSSGTLYHFRVKSRDSSGNLAISSDYTFTTLSASFSELNGFGMNGSVYAIAQSSDTSYVGGDFTEIGPYTGRGITANAANAIPQSIGSYPFVNGPVYASIPDGRGGWFIGGDFTRVGGLPRSTLAHIKTDGTVDTLWNGSTNGTSRAVLSLALNAEKTMLYAAGNFSAINGSTTRGNIAAFSAVDGSAAALNVSANGPVNVILVHGDRLYVGGAFSTLGSSARSRLGSIVLSTGALDASFAPTVDSAGEVMSLAWSAGPSDRLLVGGTFSSVNGTSRSRLAALHPTTGDVLDLSLAIGGTLSAGPSAVHSIVSIPGTQRAMFRSSLDTSGDGRYTAYAGTFDDASLSDVYFRDAVTGTTTLVSIGVDHASSDGDSLFPVISSDGRFVAFESSATNLVTGDTNAKRDIFLYDRQSATLTLISRSSAGTQGNGDSIRPTISSDGRFVAFESSATNLVTGDTNAKRDIFLYDRTTSLVTRVSIASDGTQGNGDSDMPALSGNGRFVAFWSNANTLVTSDTNGLRDGFIRDTQTNQTTRFSVTSGGAQVSCPATGQNGSLSPQSLSLSTDGRYVAYASLCDDIVTGDTDGSSDAFVFDRQTTTTQLVSTGCRGVDYGIDLSGDGRYLSFAAAQCDSAPGTESNNATDLFLRDVQASSPTLLPPGNLDGGHGFIIAMSTDARYIGFLSVSPAFGGDGSHANVATYDRQLSTTSSISRYFVSDAIYIGGNFTTVAGNERSGGAQFSSLALMKPWNPQSSGPITSLVQGGTVMYAGGTFTSIGGMNANAFAALDSVTGTAYPWSANLRLPSQNGSFTPSVYTVSASGSIRLYIGGNFTTVNPFPRNRLAAFTTSDAALLGWNPSVTGTAVYALKIIGSTLFIGGDFSKIGTLTRTHLGAATLASLGNPTSWAPAGLNGDVRTIDGNSSALYVGGSFTAVGGGGVPVSTRNHLAAFHTGNASLLSWNPNASGTVSDLVLNGAIVYLTGHDGTLVGGQSAVGAVAVDGTTGARFGWAPLRDSRSMCIIGGQTFIAGSMQGGVADASRLSSHDVVTGNAAGISLLASAPILDVSCSDSLVFLGGQFATIGGQTRNQLAVLDPLTGSILSYWNPDAGDYGRSFKTISAQTPRSVLVGDSLHLLRYAY